MHNIVQFVFVAKSYEIYGTREVLRLETLVSSKYGLKLKLEESFKL